MQKRTKKLLLPCWHRQLINSPNVSLAHLELKSGARLLSASERIIEHYRRHGLAWSRDRAALFHEAAWLDRFMALMPAGAAVLDIGCGAGAPMARYLMEHGCNVTGVDAAPEMIELCSARFPESTWLVGDMRALALGRRFHGMLAWDSFFHLNHADQRGMFPRFRDHAKAGAVLMFNTGTSHGEAIGEYAREPLYHASLDTAEYRALLQDNGFEVVAHVAADASCGHRTIWLAQRRLNR